MKELLSHRYWKPIGIPLVAISVIVLMWVAFNNRFTINPDGVAYISIAEHYVRGDLRDAVNGYWSPLLSWLMVPFLWLGLSGQEAFSIILFCSGIFILFFGSWLAWRYTKQLGASLLYWAGASPFVIYLMTSQITPDTLVIVWVLCATFIFTMASTRLDITRSGGHLWRWAAGLALFGFIGYLTKLYLQPVFLVSFPVFILLYLHLHTPRIPRRLWVRHGGLFLLITLGIYGLLCLLWIVPLSKKYDRVTLGASYSYNTRLGSYKPQENSLIAPPHDKAITGWEDPSYIQVSSGDTAAGSSLLQRLMAIYNGFPLYLAKVADLWVFLFTPIIAALAWLLIRRHRQAYEPLLIYGLMVFAVYFGIFIAKGTPGNSRYQWPLLVASIFIFALLGNWLWRTFFSQVKVWWQKIGAICLLALFPLTLFFQYASSATTYRFASPPILQQVAMAVQQKKVLPPGSHIAARDFSTATNFAYFSNTISYGAIPKVKDIKKQPIKEQLARYDIRYFLDVTNPAIKTDYGSKNKVIYTQSLPGYCDGECQLRIVELGR